VTFRTAVRTCLRQKYLTFSGRAARSEYWWFALFSMLVFLGSGIAFGLLAWAAGAATGAFAGDWQGTPVAVALFGLLGLAELAVIIGLFLPGVAVLVRRFHDLGLSGWLYLLLLALSFIPAVGGVAGIAILVICCIKGTEGPNKFGPDPLEFRTSADVFA
jgi:uncharacterized membrane protein YhaH (DUF805 family)